MTHGFNAKALPFQGKRKFVFNIKGKKLLLGILKQGSGLTGNLGRGLLRGGRAVDQHPALKGSAEVMGAQAVEQPDERGFAASACAGAEHEFARLYRKAEVAHGRALLVRVSVGDVFTT